MIPLLSIRFICIGGETRCGKFVLNEELHREILAACDGMESTIVCLFNGVLRHCSNLSAIS